MIGLMAHREFGTAPSCGWPFSPGSSCWSSAGSPSSAGAHPLGNVTVNRYARVEVSAGVVRVYYVLDNAEIPAFQERQAVEADRAGYLRAEVERIREGLELTVDGRPLELRAVRTGLDQPEGEAGLLHPAHRGRSSRPVSRPARRRVPSSLAFADRNEPQRLGWREIVVVARGDAELRTSTAPARDLSDELRSYPDDLIQAPLDLRSVEATFVPGPHGRGRRAPPPRRRPRRSVRATR